MKINLSCNFLKTWQKFLNVIKWSEGWRPVRLFDIIEQEEVKSVLTELRLFGACLTQLCVIAGIQTSNPTIQSVI